MSNRSIEWGKDFQDIDKNAKPILLGYEYFTMTMKLGYSTAALAVLGKAGVDTTEMTIPEAINACDVTDLGSLSFSTLSPIIFPLGEAIAKAVETGTGDAWIAAWSKVTGLDAANKYSAMELAQQMYLEQQLHNILTN
jgi:hypothetical protein